MVLLTNISKLYLLLLEVCKIFNLVFDSGIVPDSWSIEIILPIYKNKGDPLDPENCRAMTLVSCFGKLFTSILNKRPTLFSNQTEILKEKQTGFRKGYSTTDNIYSLHALISLYFSFDKQLYCLFIDLKKAFDKVWRAELWQKLLKSEIKGKCFNIIFNMYQNIKSCVRYHNQTSDFFSCLTSVRQGEILFSFLFGFS